MPGGDTLLTELLSDYKDLDVFPETILFSAREYKKTSLKGDLIDSKIVKERLNLLADRIIKKYNK